MDRRHLPGGHDRLNIEAERIRGVEVGGLAVAFCAEGMNLSYSQITRGCHLRHRLSHRLDYITNMVEPAASITKPLRMDARPAHRFDQLVLRTAASERKSQCPLGWLATVFTTLPIRPEKPSTPRPRAQRVKATDRILQIRNDERELEWGATVERRNHSPLTISNRIGWLPYRDGVALRPAGNAYES